MIHVDFHNREGDEVASVETKEGAIPRVGEVIRVADIDYKVEFVRWTFDEEGTLVQVMVERLPSQGGLWPDGAPAKVHELFTKGEKT